MIMSCNQDHFIEQEKVCKATYLSNLPENISYIIYRGGYENCELVDDLLQLQTNDELEHTFKKTYDAFNIANNIFEYDYILRTNTSTYINIELLNAFVQSLNNDVDVWGSELIYDQSEDIANCIYLRGNALLLSKRNVEIIINRGMPFYFLNMPFIDDWTIGSIFSTESTLNHDSKFIIKSYTECWYKSSALNYDGHQISNMSNTNKDFDFLKNIIAIQIRNYYDRSLETKHFMEIHEVFMNNKYDNIFESIKYIYDYSLHPDLFLGHTFGFVQITYNNGYYNFKIENGTS